MTMPVELCVHCGQVKRGHDCTMSQRVLPPGCKCDPKDWYDPRNITPTCKLFVGNTLGLCDTCDHLLECHQ